MATGYLDRELGTTRYFRNLEQSEKVGVSFLLGEAFTHWYAQSRMRIEFLVHVSSLTSCTWASTGAVTSFKTGATPPSDKSRPDFIGIRRTQRHVFESKGRVRKPSAATVNKGLGQVSKLQTIDGIAPTTRCATFFMLREAGAEGRVIDPPGATEGFSVTFDRRDALAKAYSFFLEIEPRDLSAEVGEGFVGRQVDDDVFFALDRKVYEAIRERSDDATTRQHQFDEVFGILEGRADVYEGKRSAELSPGRDGTLLLDRRDPIRRRRPIPSEAPPQTDKSCIIFST
jgi:mannose-6-phosphate isomerase-like protein (cupin superfamily)